ncbi:MAG: phage tail protein [Bacteroidia bacterium]|nr:phage tail protein [Bacteroidia bacterium]
MEGYIAEMRYFASNFAPKNWALCSGQLLSIASNQALFSLLGTVYGGDGRTTFGLPDARGRFIVSPGQGPGLSNYVLGQKGGSQSAVLTLQNLPSHTHTPTNSAVSGNVTIPATFDTSTDNPNGNHFGAGDGVNPYNNGNAPDTSLAASAVTGITPNLTIGTSGGSQPMPIQSPYLGLNVVICQYGIYPSRN